MGHGASSRPHHRRHTEPSVPASADAAAHDDSPASPTPSRSSSSALRHSPRLRLRAPRLHVNVHLPHFHHRQHIHWVRHFDQKYTLGGEVMPSTNYGTSVQYAVRASDGKSVVVKLRSKTKSFSGDEETHKAWRESTEYLLNLPRHEHITQIYEVLEDHEAYYVVMEQVDGLDLYEVLGSQERPSYLEIREILKQLLEAVAALHEKGWIHRDLKLENVMVDHHDHGQHSPDSPKTPHSPKSAKSSGGGRGFSPWSSKSRRSREFSPPRSAKSKTDSDMASADEGSEHGDCMTKSTSVKLIDFDTVMENKPKADCKRVMGTDMYIAQEAYAGHYSPASDIYSVGVIAYKLLTGRFPFTESVFRGEEDNLVGSPSMQRTRQKIRDYEIDWSRPPFDTDTDARELCKSMMHSQDVERPSAKQALEHQWFTKELGA